RYGRKAAEGGAERFRQPPDDPSHVIVATVGLVAETASDHAHVGREVEVLRGRELEIRSYRRPGLVIRPIVTFLVAVGPGHVVRQSLAAAPHVGPVGLGMAGPEDRGPPGDLILDQVLRDD